MGRDDRACPRDDVELNSTIDRLGVALGDTLVASLPALAWTVATDLYGTTIAVTGDPETAKVIVDPFNFVAKRWDDRVPRFLAHGAARLIETIGELR